MEETSTLKNEVLQLEDIKLDIKSKLIEENKNELPISSIIIFCLPAFTKMAALVLLK
jgi:hypothetical protein